MATLYFVHGNLTNQWNDVNNWSTSSGGPGGHALPTSSDDVVIDGNSPNTMTLGAILPYGLKCRNLTVNTGFAFTMTYTTSPFGFTVAVFGQLNLLGTTGNNISINASLGSYGGHFNVFGSVGTVTHVIADHLYSFGGLRIQYNPLTCTITNCPMWVSRAPITTHITTAAGLQAMNDNLNDNYILDNDIDLEGVTWTTVGINSNPFTGSLDGQGHTIKNLSSDQGLFGQIGSSWTAGEASAFTGGEGSGAYMRATIQDLNIDGFTCTIVAPDDVAFVGALAGSIYSGYISNIDINNVYIAGAGDSDHCGGLAGSADGYSNLPTIITDVTITAFRYSLTDPGGFAEKIGAFIGETSVQSSPSELTMSSIFVENYLIDQLYPGQGEIIGGLIGSGFGGQLRKCFSDGEINSPDGGSQFGGLIGYSYKMDVKDCYTVGTIIGGDTVGGLIGDFYQDSTVLNCYADVVITADAGSDSVGGLIGTTEAVNSQTIQNSYSTGVITGGATNIGGFIGALTDHTKLTLTNCDWFTGASTNAIGGYDGGGAKATLAMISAGADTGAKSSFYHKTHAVYAQ